MPYTNIGSRILGTLVAFLGTCVAFSQTVQWTPTNGPYGGTIHSFAVHPLTGTEFAGIFGGLYKSVDKGNTWTYTALQAATLFDMAVNNKGYLFAGDQSGVARTTDEGMSWSFSTNIHEIVFSVAVNRANQNVYAGTKGGYIYRSTDEGISWTVVHGATLFDTDVLGMCGTASGAMLAGTYGNGMYRSNDNGATWVRVGQATLPSGIVSLAYDPVNTMAYAGAGKIFRSSDDGVNWTGYDLPDQMTIYSIALNSLGRVVAGTDEGVYQSLDFGATWQAFNGTLPAGNVRAVCLIDSLPAILAGVENDGLYRSPITVPTWSQRGLKSPAVFFLGPDHEGRIFAGTNDSVFVTTDKGSTWTTSNTGIPTQFTNAIVSYETLLFAGTRRGVYYSDNQGSLWTERNNGLGNTPITALAADAQRNRLFAGTAKNLFTSTDEGLTWIASNTGLVDSSITALAVNLINGDAFAGTQTEGVYRSMDGGRSWTAANGGWNNPNVNTLAVANQSGTLFAGTSGQGVYRTTNNGTDWNESNGGLPNAAGIYVQDIVVDSMNRIYIGLFGDGVYRTTDDGLTWNAFNTGIETGYVSALCVDANDFLFAGLLNDGVYRADISTTPLRPLRSGIDASFRIESSFPNPFRSSAVLRYDVERNIELRISIKDMLGREIRVLEHRYHQPGAYSVEWHADHASGGVYWIVVDSHAGHVALPLLKLP